MATKYRYSVEPCPVCNAWAVKAQSVPGEDVWICNNLGAYWHGYYKEQQALQQSWKKAHS